jgi:carbamoyltransferase
MRSCANYIAPVLRSRSWRALHNWRHQNQRVDVILGIACTGHGASLGLLTSDGAVRSSVLERWAGTKRALMLAKEEDHDLRHPRSRIDRQIHFCIQHGYGKFPHTCIFEETLSEWLAWLQRGLQLTPSDVDLVVTSESFFATCDARVGSRLTRWFPNAWLYNSADHHHIHQCQAFWQSGFNEAAVLTLDSAGQARRRLGKRKLSGTIAAMNNTGRREELSYLFFPENSAGFLYEVFTRHAGFRLGDEGKTMGLAPYGGPELLRQLEADLQLEANGSFRFVDHHKLQNILEQYVPERKEDQEIDQKHCDVAYAGQVIIERIVSNAMMAALRLCSRKKLVYSGGVALNSVANEIALSLARPEHFYIPPNPGDTGQGLGCALYGAYEIAGWPPRTSEMPEYLGPSYSESEMYDTVRSSGFHVTRAGELEEQIARIIANGHIVARFHGGAEYGPRALGNRSILCDPRRHDMKNYLNSKVKHREKFRPFAPAVLESAASEWFEITGRSPFMLRVVPARAAVRERIPAVVHVDGSCRLQTVAERDNPGLYRIIKKFERLTGVPILLNTSFNTAGKPIVETPADAVVCFASTEIDLLALGPFLLSKRPLTSYMCSREEWHAAQPAG